ncbi:MAG: hypothetical protein KKG60_01290 [Nanoarchaeota archaeon]|nr:hypothetical protein [Nanoarchaeota archaeon]
MANGKEKKATPYFDKGIILRDLVFKDVFDVAKEFSTLGDFTKQENIIKAKNSLINRIGKSHLIALGLTQGGDFNKKLYDEDIEGLYQEPVVDCLKGYAAAKSPSEALTALGVALENPCNRYVHSVSGEIGKERKIEITDEEKKLVDEKMLEDKIYRMIMKG